MPRLDLTPYFNALNAIPIQRDLGKVTHVTGFLIRGYMRGASVGTICEINPNSGAPNFLAEVIGFQDNEVLMMPLSDMHGVGLGSRILPMQRLATIPVGDAQLGRVLDGLAQPIDGKGDVICKASSSLYKDGTNPLSRPPISHSLSLGVRSIDGLVTLGKGQRVGIMSGSGVGKSVLLGMMARSSQADVNVIAMVGERGREVREFIEKTLGEEGMKKSVVVVATSDQSPLMRMRAAFVATTIAEHFSRGGKDVLLVMDSVTRFAMAQREIGLNVGEPPTTKGYTPSVFSLLPKLLERAGTFEGQGSITGLYTVLVEGDDMNDPIGDSVRSIVDGHIVLSRRLAHRGHYPAVDVLQSTSRVQRQVISPEHLHLAQQIRELMATYSEAEDLINIGAYKTGANAKIDMAIRMQPLIEQFLRQQVDETTSLEESVSMMANMG